MNWIALDKPFELPEPEAEGVLPPDAEIVDGRHAFRIGYFLDELTLTLWYRDAIECPVYRVIGPLSFPSSTDEHLQTYENWIEMNHRTLFPSLYQTGTHQAKCRPPILLPLSQDKKKDLSPSGLQLEEDIIYETNQAQVKLAKEHAWRQEKLLQFRADYFICRPATGFKASKMKAEMRLLTLEWIKTGELMHIIKASAEFKNNGEIMQAASENMSAGLKKRHRDWIQTNELQKNSRGKKGCKSEKTCPYTLEPFVPMTKYAQYNAALELLQQKFMLRVFHRVVSANQP